jgi:hypothetical protein
MHQSQQFVQVLQSSNPNAVYETIRKVILADDQLDDKTRIQKLIHLMHSYKKVKTSMNTL